MLQDKAFLHDCKASILTLLNRARGLDPARAVLFSHTYIPLLPLFIQAVSQVPTKQM